VNASSLFYILLNASYTSLLRSMHKGWRNRWSSINGWPMHFKFRKHRMIEIIKIAGGHDYVHFTIEFG